MVNKKIILSILAVGMLATVAGAGTWAFFQDTIASDGNGVVTGDLATTVTVDGIAVTPDPTTGVFDAGHIYTESIIPGQVIPGKTIAIANVGDVKSKVVATITPVSEGVVDDLTITVGSQIIYKDGVFVSDLTLDLGTLNAGTGTTDADIEYTFEETNVNQNAQQDQTVSFDMSITVTAVE